MSQETEPPSPDLEASSDEQAVKPPGAPKPNSAETPFQAVRMVSVAKNMLASPPKLDKRKSVGNEGDRGERRAEPE
jgi:hypothetical protein